MAVAWTLFQILMIFTYHDPSEIGMDDDTVEEKCLIQAGEASLPEDELQTQELTTSEDDFLNTEEKNDSPKILTLLRLYRAELVDSAIAVCLGVFFLTLFVQTNSETVITPLMEAFFHSSTLETSCFFAVLGLVALLACLVVSWLGKRKADDRRVAAVGFFLIILSNTLALIIFPRGKYGQRYLQAAFFTIFLVYIVGHAILVVSNFIIYSKLVSNECLGFAMGLKRSLDILAMILGPLWAGSHTEKLYHLFGVNLGLCLFITFLFLLSYKTMVRA